jgi:hypothetical protein
VRMGLKDKENAMALLSSNLLGVLNKSPGAGVASAMASVSGSANGQIVSASARVESSAHGQDATSVIHATAQAQADDIQVTSTGNAMASGGTAATLVSVAANADPETGIVAAGAATAAAKAEAAENGLASTAIGAATEVEANDIEITSSGDAAAGGQEARTLVTTVASLDPQAEIPVMALAQAEARAAEDGAASATASTDAGATDDNLVISKEQETIMTDGSYPTVLSFTYLQGVQAAPADAVLPEALVRDVDVATLQSDVGSFNGDL